MFNYSIILSILDYTFRAILTYVITIAKNKNL